MVTLKRIYFSEIYISIQIYDFLLVFLPKIGIRRKEKQSST